MTWLSRIRLIGERRRQRGLALILVLWSVVVLSLLAAGYLDTTRGDIRLARNLIDNAQAEALADGAVEQAVLALLLPVRQGGWRADGAVYAWRFADGELRVAVADESGKIDLNVGGDGYLSTLFVVAGLPEADAEVLVDRIRDYADSDGERRPNGAEDGDYAAAGLFYDAKDAAFETVSELRQIPGMTPALYELLAPALTVHSGLRVPQQVVAPPVVREVLARMPEAGGGGAEAGPDEGVTVAIEPGVLGELDERPVLIAEGWAPESAGRSRFRVFTIHAEARSGSGGVFVREAVVRLVATPEAPYQVLDWRQGPRRLFPPAEKTAEQIQ
jgi:general secretion pathway protein K